MRSILITGGTGSLGHGLVEQLLQTRIERICILSRSEHKQAAMERKFDDPRLRFFLGDVRDRDRLYTAFDGIEEVVHAAALKDITKCEYNPREATLTNDFGSQNVIDAAKYTRVLKVLLTSTDKAVEPINHYGVTKKAAEGYFRSSQEQRRNGHPLFGFTRFGNVWDSTGSIAQIWRDRLRESNIVPVTNPRCTRFFMLRAQAVSFVLRALDNLQGYEPHIPELPAYEVGDLAIAFNAEQKVIGLSKYEKLHEKMREGPETSEHARRMTIEELRAVV